MFSQSFFFLCFGLPLFSFGQDEEIQVWLTTPLDRENLLTRQAGLKWTLSDQTSSEHVVDIDDSATYQEIDGLGGTLSDVSAWLMTEKMDANKRQKLLTSLFDRHKGIGLNAIRVAIGPSSFSRTNRTYADKCCSLEDFDLSIDKDYLIPTLKAALGVNKDVIFFAVSFSPPPWMKTSESIIGGQLKVDQFGNLATYFTRFVREYQKEKLPIYALIVQNEPQYRSCCAPSMWMDADEQAYFISEKLSQIFRKYNIDTKIVATTNNWDILNTYGSEVLKNPGARTVTNGIAFQCYRGSPTEQSVFRERYPDKNLWLMECTDEEDNANQKIFETHFRRNMNREVIGSFRNYARAIMKFNLVLDQRRGPHNGGCTNCLGMITLDTRTGEYGYNAAYYAYGHLSKFVRKGAKRILSSTSTSYTVETVAFQNPDGDNVLLVYNNLKEFPLIFKAQWDGRFFAYTLPPYAAATFVWKGRAKPRTAFERIEAESYFDAKAISIRNCNDSSGCGSSVGSFDSGAYLLYKNLDFGTGANTATFRSISKGSTLIELRIDNLIEAKSTVALVVTAESNRPRQVWKTKSVDMNKVQGVHDLYVVFKGNKNTTLEINWFIFSQSDERLTNETSNLKPVEISQDNFYKIVARHSDKVLDVDSRDRKNNTPVQQWDYYHVDWQKFSFQKSRLNGCYLISSKNSALVLQATNDSMGERVRVRQKRETGKSNQMWKILKTDSGYFKIISCANNLAMEIESGETESGTLVVLGRDQKNKLEQMFSIVLVEPFPLETNVTDVERRKGP